MSKKANTKQSRSWPVTVISAIISVTFLFLAIISFVPNMLAIVISIAFFALAVLAAAISIRGDRDAFTLLLRILPRGW